MVDRFWYFVMVPMVYISLAWFVVWMVIRIARVVNAPKTPHTVRIFDDDSHPDSPPPSFFKAVWDAFVMPSVLRDKPTLWLFLLLFHVAAAVLFVSHLDLLPYVSIMSAESPHMIGNGAVGVVVIVCLLFLLFRRFVPPVSEISMFSDYFLLFLLICVAVSGSIISWGNSWTENGFVISKQDFGLYLDSLIRFTFKDPREYLSGAHYSIAGSHILLANLFLLFIPFSKVLHFCFAVPLNKIRRG